MRLWTAASQGNVAAVKQRLDSGDDVDQRDADGRTALMHAAEKGQLEILNVLIEAGADVNLQLTTPEQDELDQNEEDDDEEDEDDYSEQGCALLNACNSDADESMKVAIVQRLLDAGADVNVADADGCTPLMTAVSCEERELVRQLLSVGADVNTADDEGKTPLLVALGADENREVVKGIIDDLLAAGADIQHADQQGQTPLMLAAAKAYVDVVKLLLERGAAVDAIDAEGRSALSRAAESLANLSYDQNQSSFDLDEQRAALKQMGIDPDAKSAQSLLSRPQNGPDELTLMLSGADSAEEFESTRKTGISWLNEIINLLLENNCPYGNAAPALVKAGWLDLVKSAAELDLNAQDELGQTPMTEAIDRGDVKRVRSLLELGADPNACNYFDQTPLMMVHHSRRGFACARLLAEAEADLNYRSEKGVSLLEVTVADADFEKIEFFLELGAEARLGAPLLWAARRDNVEIVRLLIKHHADPNVALDGDGKSSFAGFFKGSTPLMVAAAKGNDEIVSLLLEAGADVDAADRKGNTAIEVAMKHGRLEIARRLRQLVKTDASIHEYTAALLPSVEKGDAQQVRECIAGGANVNIQGERGITPLILAAREGYEEIVTMLLEAGGKVNACSAAGYGGHQTPLRCAVVRNHTSIVKKLLEAGADPNPVYEYSSIPTEKHNTVVSSLGSALHDAARSGNDEVVNMLLDSGADVNVVDTHTSETPLVSAVRGRQWVTARLLIDRGAQRRAENKDFLAVLDFAAAAKTPEFGQSVKQMEDLCQSQAEHQEKIPGMVVLTVMADGSPPPNDGSQQGYKKQFEFGAALDRKKWNVLDAGYDACLRRQHLLIDSGMPFLGNEKRYLYLYPTDDKYAVLASIGVNGNEVELSTSDIINWLRDFEAVHPYRLRGCRYDTVVIEFVDRPADVEATAKRLNEFCPDLVAQNFDSMEALVTHLENHRRLTLWWD